MRHKQLFQFIAIVVLGFFLTILLSDIFFKIAERQTILVRQKRLKSSLFCFPLDFFVSYVFGMTFLEKGYKTGETGQVQESILWLKKSIRQNPFFHLSHHHLGKAYLLINSSQNEFFDSGIQEFKKAVEIFRNHKNMAKDTVAVLLSLWPLLSREDQEQCRSLFLGLMPKLSWEEFKSLAESWWLYCKDEDFLKELLGKRGDFLTDTADVLVEFRAPLSLRWKFLAEGENWTLKQVIQKYRIGTQDEPQQEFEFSLLERLRTNKAYYLLEKNKSFDREKYIRQKNILLLNRIRHLLNSYSRKPDAVQYNEIQDLIYEYMEGQPEAKELGELADLLKSTGYVRPNDLKSLYLKYRLDFRESNFNDLIDEIEKLKNDISFMKKENTPDFVKILLLLSDAYESSKLLTVADQTLREVLKLDPENAEAWFRLARIQLVLGDEDENTRALTEKLVFFKNSRFVTVEGLKQENIVYLIEDFPVEISISPQFKNQLRGKNLIQIFVDEKIRYEEYLDRLPEKISLTVKEGTEMQKVQIQVKFL